MIYATVLSQPCQLCDNFVTGQSCKKSGISFKRTKFHMHVYVSVLFLLLKITHASVSLDGLLGEGDRL